MFDYWRDILPRKISETKDVRSFALDIFHSRKGNWKTSYFRGWIPDELLLKGLPLVSIRRVQGYFCKGGGGSLVLPKSEYEQTETPSAHGIALKPGATFRTRFKKQNSKHEKKEKKISTR